MDLSLSLSLVPFKKKKGEKSKRPLELELFDGMDLSLSLSLVPSKRKRDEYYFSSSDEPFDTTHPDEIEPRTKDLFSKLRLVPSKRQRNENFSCDDNNDDDDKPFRRSKRPKHDVFLSYSNEEIGKSFVSHLKGALERNCIDISDHTTLPIGQNESFQLLKAIEESWIHVVVFSIEYPFSEKCLDELVLICDSISKSKNMRRVVPIFYKVVPSHVSQQHGSFLQAFQAHHDNHVDRVKVEKWKHALKDVGELSGEAFQTGDNEEEFVRKIVKMLGKLKLPVELFDADHAVGIEPRAQNLISKLRLRDSDPSITAVVGMSGSGKTTLAKAVYDRIVPDFDANCFIENISHYKYRIGPNWKVDLQHEVISRFNGDDYRIHNVSASSTIKKFVSNRKVLLVLDDVDKYDQLQALGIQDPASFGWGSRILVTTTNKQSLCGLKIYTSYNMELLNLQESSELFSGLAYEEGQSADKEFVDEIAHRAGGVPLVLDIWGRYFKCNENKRWQKLLKKLRRIPHEDVQGKLQVSYDSLSPQAKNLFLDIACFFDGNSLSIKDDVIEVLEDEDNAFLPDIEIQDLIDKGLVKDSKVYVSMHALIRDLGREVVRQENVDDPGQRSRLAGSDVILVLRNCSGTNSIRSINFGLEDLIHLNSDEYVTIQVYQALRKMSNLRFIKLFWTFKLNYMVSPDDSDEIMSPLRFKHLKFLEWEGFPFKCLDKFHMENVIVIRLWRCELEILWKGFKSLKKLKILDVNRSFKFKKTGSFIGLENLTFLSLRGCENLKELDCSIGCLQKLVTLDLTGCYELKMIPWEMIHKLTSLEILNMRACPNILNIYHELWNLPNISSIYYKLENTGELWNPPKNFNIISGPPDRLGYTVVPKEKLDSMGGTSKGQGELPAFPKFRYIEVTLIKSHDQNFKWRVFHCMK